MNPAFGKIIIDQRTKKRATGLHILGLAERLQERPKLLVDL
jgi:hypothetical protein